MVEKRSQGDGGDGGGLYGPVPPRRCREAVPQGASPPRGRLRDSGRSGLILPEQVSPSDQELLGRGRQFHGEQTRLCLEGPGGADGGSRQPVSSVGRPAHCFPSREGRIEPLGEAPRLVSEDSWAVASGPAVWSSGRVTGPGLRKGAGAWHGPWE